MTVMRSEKLSEATVKSGVKDTLILVCWALIIAFVLRVFLFQPFHIPSGSMQPNLVKGDYIITTKYSVGYGRYAASPFPFPSRDGRWFEREPSRGDVLVFRPKGQSKTFIKRLAGLPGDAVEMRGGVLYINDISVGLEPVGLDVGGDTGQQSVGAEIWSETFPNGHTHLVYDKTKQDTSDTTRSVIVPDGHYFFLGDNRDESADSRVQVSSGGAGLVPRSHIIGRAEFVLLSASEKFSLFKPWTWGHMRSERFFKGLR